MESSSQFNNPDRPLSSYPAIVRITEEQLDRLLRRVAWAVRQQPELDQYWQYDIKQTLVPTPSPAITMVVDSNVNRRGLILAATPTSSISFGPSSAITASSGIILSSTSPPLQLWYADAKGLVTCAWFGTPTVGGGSAVVIELLRNRSPKVL